MLILTIQDPCIGENKKLRVRYLFRNRMHQVTVDDIAALRAPLKGGWDPVLASARHSPPSRHLPLLRHTSSRSMLDCPTPYVR
jgi:hypothetical protein